MELARMDEQELCYTDIATLGRLSVIFLVGIVVLLFATLWIAGKS